MRRVAAGAVLTLLVGCSFDLSTCAPVSINGTETLHLYVSNQSFEIDPVDIEVYIDDQPVICDDFFVEGQHNWILHDLRLAPGDHSLRAVGHDGKTTLEETFRIDGEKWAVVDFWFYPGEPEEFSFFIQDAPIGFA